MGISIWFFSRPRPGELCPLALSAAEAFLSGGGRLPVDADGFVRYAEVIVRLQDHRAIEVLRVGFYQYRTLKNGTLDRKHLHDIMAAGTDAAFGWLKLDEPPPGVVTAEHKFAKRRLEHLNQWKPTKAELAKLGELVNQRARTELAGINRKLKQKRTQVASWKSGRRS